MLICHRMLRSYADICRIFDTVHSPMLIYAIECLEAMLMLISYAMHSPMLMYAIECLEAMLIYAIECS